MKIITQSAFICHPVNKLPANTTEKHFGNSETRLSKQSEVSKSYFSHTIYQSIKADSKSKKHEGLGLAGLILSLPELPLMISFGYGIILSAIGIIFSVISLRRFKKEPGNIKVKDL